MLPFRPRFPWWGGDLQTLRNRLVYRRRLIEGDPEDIHFETRDGSGDVLTATLNRAKAPSNSPLVLLIHGLTGDENSAYMIEAARYHLMQGSNVLRLNLRGAGSSKETCGWLYSGASWSDILAVLPAIDAALTTNGIVLVGFSMGGNILLNALAKMPQDTPCIGAITISAPIDPLSASKRLMQRRNWIYQRALLIEMKQAYLDLPTVTDPDLRKTIQAARSIYEFDDAITGPQNGFEDAPDYYSKTAGKDMLGHISLPLLLIHAHDDPWIPIAPYKTLTPPSNVEIILSDSGGHVGFHGSESPYPWHDRVASEFIKKL